MIWQRFRCLGLPGSNWKYLEYLEALQWHRVPKPTTWQLAHDLPTQTKRNRQWSWDLEYQWCTKTSAWSDSEAPVPFLAGNSLIDAKVLLWRLRSEAQFSTLAHTTAESNESRTSEKSWKTDLNVRANLSRRETSAQLDTAFIVATTKLQSQDVTCKQHGLPLCCKRHQIDNENSSLHLHFHHFPALKGVCFIFCAQVVETVVAVRQSADWSHIGVTWNRLLIACHILPQCPIMSHLYCL